MRKTILATIAAGLMAFSAAGRAETLVFEGTIPSNRAVVHVSLNLARDLSDVVLWTDSYNEGIHFDPIVALWRDGALLGENDDRPTLMPGQTGYDSGLVFGHLDRGTYLVTITNFSNFANGGLLGDGFRFDDPSYPANELNNCMPGGDCPGNYWRLNLADGVPVQVPQVPEPATFGLWIAGLALLAARAYGRLGHPCRKTAARPRCRPPVA